MENKTLLERYNALKAMNTLMLLMNNEEAYYSAWIMIVPDEATDEDLMNIADDEDLYKEAVTCYLDCMYLYGKDGLYIGAQGEAKLYCPHDWAVDPSKASEEDL